MTKKRALGRGLGALIPGAPEEGDERDGVTGLREVAPGAIDPNPQQPRSQFDEADLADLAESIRAHGLIQPLIVQDAGDGRFTLIAGERRWRAARQIGLETVPVVVKEATPQAMLEMALIENVQRADLSPIEEALAYRQLVEEFGLTQEAIATSVGKARTTVTNIIRLLDLPPKVQQAVLDGRLTGAHARRLLPLRTPEAQITMMNTVVNLGLNVRQTDAAVKKIIAGTRPQPRTRRAANLSPALIALQEELRQSLGTRVDVKKGRKGGQVVIHFYSDEELQAIYDAIVGDV